MDWSTTFSSAVVAAIVAAIVSLLGHWVSRQNTKLTASIAQENARLSAKLESAIKLADSRQHWINELRQDMAAFLGLAVIRNRSRIAGETMASDDFEQLLTVSSRISMRMNPNDADYVPLTQAMAQCMFSEDPLDSGKVSRNFVAICQRILKREWDVLKRDLKDLNLLDEPVR